MPLPVVHEDIRHPLCHKILKATTPDLNMHPFFRAEADRIKEYNPEVIRAIEFFSQDAEEPSIRDLPEQVKDCIRRKTFRLAILVYLLLESQQQVDDIEEEMK